MMYIGYKTTRPSIEWTLSKVLQSMVETDAWYSVHVMYRWYIWLWAAPPVFPPPPPMKIWHCSIFIFLVFPFHSPKLAVLNRGGGGGGGGGSRGRLRCMVLVVALQCHFFPICLIVCLFGCLVALVLNCL